MPWVLTLESGTYNATTGHSCPFLFPILSHKTQTMIHPKPYPVQTSRAKERQSWWRLGARVVDRRSNRTFCLWSPWCRCPCRTLSWGELGGTLVTLGCLSLRSSQSQRLFLKPAIPLSPGEEPARTNRSAGAREVCFISILETRSWASLCLSFLTQRTGGFVLWCPISSLCFLPLSPYNP